MGPTCCGTGPGSSFRETRTCQRPAEIVSMFVLKSVSFLVLQSALFFNTIGSYNTTTENSTDPYFDMTGIENVTSMAGKTAYLNCRVKNLGNKTVSWIRHRDIHILTVGQYTYTNDQRFQTVHYRDTEDWTLQIKYAQVKDSGLYECQVSTQPIRSFFVNLSVVVPLATILGVPDLYVDKGSMINLTCVIRFSVDSPDYLFWYHENQVINYDSPRGGVSVITEKGKVTTSYLLLQNAQTSDSGRYTCSPSNSNSAAITVHVLNGEAPAAMYSKADTRRSLVHALQVTGTVLHALTMAAALSKMGCS